MKRLLHISLCALFFLHSQAQQDTDAKLFLDRSRLFLLATENSAGKIAPASLQINADGSWSDIDYHNDQPGVWSTAAHLSRTRELALAWNQPRSPWYHNATVKQTIIAALDHWAIHRYQNKNWWHNQIGIPQIARDLLLLMTDSFPVTAVQQTRSILAQYNLCCTGANLVWSAGLGLYYGAFTNDAALMKKCRDTILSTIVVTTAEGVQPDFSFHQHNNRLQIYHYGGAFLRDNVQLAWVLAQTSLAYPPEKINIFTNFVLLGWQWMARGIHTVPGTVDRAVSRVNALHSADIRTLLPYLSELAPNHAAAFKQLQHIQEGQGSLHGYRYYPRSDFTAYHQQGFSFFLKTNSTRTLLTESINEENLKGNLLDAGDAYFISDGQEYFNIQPCWNWDALPGITNFNSTTRNNINRRAYTGNVSDSLIGLAAMDYAIQNKTQTLTAKKSWACYKGVVVALIAGVSTTSVQGSVFTVFNQSRWQTAVTINKQGDTLKEGIHHLFHPRWMHQGQLVYIPLGNDSIQVAIQPVEGRWTAINRSQSNGLVHDKLFMAQLLHTPASRATGYVTAHAATPKDAAAIAGKPFWKVLSNDSVCQAVVFEKKVTMAAWYKPGKRQNIAVDQPCLLLCTPKGTYISDPLHIGGSFTGTINDRRFSVRVPADGTTVRLP